MKKRIISSVLSLMICVSLFGVYAYADTENYIFCDEDNEVLTQAGVDSFNEYAQKLYDDCGVQAFFSYVGNTGEEEVADYAEKQYNEHAKAESGVWMQLTDDYYSYYLAGEFADKVTQEDKDAMWKKWSDFDTYYDALTAYVDDVRDLYITYLSSPDSVLSDDGEMPQVVSAYSPKLVVDDGELLSEDEEASLAEKLGEVSDRRNMDVVVVTTNSLDGKSAMEYADDYFDYNGYGRGDNRDGVLLLVSMEDRDWWISTRGYGITAFSDYGIQAIGDEVVPYLTDGDYYKGFEKYAELCDDFVREAHEEKPYDTNNKPTFANKAPDAKRIIIWCLISLGAGFLLAGIPVAIMKGKLKTVRMNPDAKNYVREGSFAITNQRDMFLYRTVSKTAKPKDSGGGSSTHHSSSGASHGGGGGKF